MSFGKYIKKEKKWELLSLVFGTLIVALIAKLSEWHTDYKNDKKYDEESEPSSKTTNTILDITPQNHASEKQVF